MPGANYIALSGLRARADALDRIASDIANIGTTGYKGERFANAAAERDAFDASLRSAIDATTGGRRLDASSGALTPTGRDLDVAVDGPGFFVVETAAGLRYTRNGHFSKSTDGSLVTEEGATVQGAGGGAIKLGEGDIRIDADGSVWTGTTQAGQLAVATFDDPGKLTRDHSALLKADGLTANQVAAPVVHAGALEQSNVSVSERLAELTGVSRSFEALQKSISVLMNDIDGRVIDQFGRK